MKKLIEPLRPYAAEPNAGPPPENLPWERGDVWGLYGAARSALGLLLEGEAPGERLFEVADYLLTFFNEGYGPPMYRDARLLNGTALALCGYLCDGAHPEAELWRVTGCARLATEVHNRRAALDDRMAADCLSVVCQVADEQGMPVLADLVTLRERMWGRLLDHSRVERLHVSEAEYPSHMAEPVGAEQVGELMKGRDWQCKAPVPDFWMAPDLEDADNTCENLLTLRAHMLVRHQFGSEVDWHLRLFDDKESTVSLNAQPFIRNLAWAYALTDDVTYARHAARLLWSFYRLAPVPNHRQPLGPWRTLEVGNRQCNMWPAVIQCLAETEPFDAATHAMLARSRLEHMRYLLAFCGGANNWYQVESAGLATAALYSPELRHAEAYLRVALRRLRWINSFAYYDDGFQFELTHGYHVFPTSSMFAVVRAAQARGVALPEEYVELIEKAHEMYLYAVQPNHVLPMFNDCNPNPTDPAPFLRAAAETFGREDLLWGGTRGEKGVPPDHASHAWPSAGYYVMRDRWDKEGQYLHFDGAAYGAAHQHEDKLNFVLYSYGRLLIGDPNIYSYARTELTHYFRSSRAHNVVLIDGRGQARRFRPESRLSTLGRNEWLSREGFDFVSSEYLEGFAPRPYEPADQEVQVDHSLGQRRAIFYVKPFGRAQDVPFGKAQDAPFGKTQDAPIDSPPALPGYWILCDLLQGQDQEPHRLEQLFHIAPLETGEEQEPLRAGAVSVSPSVVLTRDEGVANLAILPVDSAGLQAYAQKGETSPAVGWYGVLGEFPAWDVTLERETSLPTRMDVVLFPLPSGQETYPEVRRLRADAQVTAFQIVGAGMDDTFLLCEEGSGPVRLDDLTFEGRALLLRRQPTTQALAVAPQSLTLGGTPVEWEGQD